MHDIIARFELGGEFRWLVAQKNPVRNGELYRYIAGACFGSTLLQMTSPECCSAAIFGVSPASLLDSCKALLASPCNLCRPGPLAQSFLALHR